MSTEIIGYHVEADDWERLKLINLQLFGDGTHLTPNHRRDLANLLHVIINRATPIKSVSGENEQ